MDDMNVVTIPIASTLEAMSSKQIDLALNNEPWITRMVQAGNVAVLTPVQELMPDSQSAITLYGPSLLDKNSDVGNRFMVAYLQAVRKYNEGKTDRNVEILAKAIKLDPALIKDMCWPALRADGSLNTASVQEFQEWAVSGKDLDAVVPEAEYWDGSFVEFANKQLEAAQ
jgi:NitT/TauT family transport system substrate-binding protein